MFVDIIQKRFGGKEFEESLCIFTINYHLMVCNLHTENQAPFLEKLSFKTISH